MRKWISKLWNKMQDRMDIPRRSMENVEEPCMSESGGRLPWVCERQSGHRGKHMAWERYSPDESRRVLYGQGVWE
jgi:hypothetical protein